MTRADEPLGPVRCQRCGAELASPVVCVSCGSLQSLAGPVDHFALLGLARSYDIEDALVQSRYRSVARRIHPDRFSGQPEAVIALAARHSAALNKAVSTLADPVTRAEYLLELHGGPSAAELREVPGDLLVEVMQLREELEEARVAEGTDRLHELQRILSTRRADALSRIAAAARSLARASAQQRRELRLLLNSVKYFDNLLATVPGDPLRPTEASM